MLAKLKPSIQGIHNRLNICDLLIHILTMDSVLVANGYGGKLKIFLVRQVRRSHNIIFQILIDIINKKLDGITEEGEKDDEPVGLRIISLSNIFQARPF
jgi:hypothetical protein